MSSDWPSKWASTTTLCFGLPARTYIIIYKESQVYHRTQGFIFNFANLGGRRAQDNLFHGGPRCNSTYYGFHLLVLEVQSGLWDVDKEELAALDNQFLES